MKRSLMVVLFLLLSSVSQAEEKGIQWPKWLAIGCIAGDLGTTEWAIHNGGREMNPIMRNRGVRLSVNIGVSFWIFKSYEPSDKKKVIFLSAIRCGVASWNVYQSLRNR